MAIFKPSHLIGAISGSVASVTFKLTRNGAVMAKRVPPKRPPSSWQLASRNRFAHIKSAWLELDSSHQRAWKSFATHLPKTNALGLAYPLTGYQMFIAHNTPAQYLGISLITDPPPNLATPPTIIQGYMFNIWINEACSLTIPGPFDPTYLIIQACRARTFGTTAPFLNKIREGTWPYNRWITLKIPSVSPGHYVADMNPECTSRIGNPRHEENIAMRLSMWHPTALRSSSVIRFGPNIT